MPLCLCSPPALGALAPLSPCIFQSICPLCLPVTMPLSFPSLSLDLCLCLRLIFKYLFFSLSLSLCVSGLCRVFSYLSLGLCLPVPSSLSGPLPFSCLSVSSSLHLSSYL